MRRIVALLLLLSLVVPMLGVRDGLAQDATPVASGEPIGPTVGTVVPYIGDDGTEVGTVSVDALTDPYVDYDPGSPPQRGYHFVQLVVTVNNTSSRPLPVYSGSFYMVDSAGFIITPTSTYTTDTPAIPELPYEDVPPAASVTGTVSFEAFNGAALQRIYLSTSSNRQVTLVDLRTDPMEVGSAATVYSAEESPVATVAIDTFVDPFEGYDPNSPPTRGSHFIAVYVVFTNVGDRPFNVDAYAISLIDRQGFVVFSSYVYRTDTTLPDLPGGELLPGATMEGLLTFSVLNGSEIAQIAYAPGYYQQLILADDPVSEALPGGSTAASTPVASSPDCEGLVEWGEDLVARLTTAGEIAAVLDVDDVSTLDPAIVRQAANDLAALGVEQAASNPPPAAVTLNELFVTEYYAALADASNSIANALEQDSAVQATLAVGKARAVEALFADGGAADLLFDELTVACPNEINILNQDN